jgi:hypothetical protein
MEVAVVLNRGYTNFIFPQKYAHRGYMRRTDKMIRVRPNLVEHVASSRFVNNTDMDCCETKLVIMWVSFEDFFHDAWDIESCGEVDFEYIKINYDNIKLNNLNNLIDQVKEIIDPNRFTNQSDHDSIKQLRDLMSSI